MTSTPVYKEKDTLDWKGRDTELDNDIEYDNSGQQPNACKCHA